MATGFIATGDWFSWYNEGAGLATADISGNGRPDLVVFQIDAPPGANQAYYRIGWDVDPAGQVAGGWGPWIGVPDWFSWENQGADIAVADLDGDGRPELIVFQIDSPVGKNEGYYRIGWKLDTNGNVTGGWGPWEPVPDWFSWENQGAGIALGDLRGSGQTDLLVFQVDAPMGVNLGFYRIGWNVGGDGKVKGGWSPWMALPGWFSWENQGAGVALADLDGNGLPELVVFQIDAPVGNNKAYYSVGWDIDANGKVGGWSPWVEIADWFSWQNQGGGLALARLDGALRPQLILLQVDNPPEQNQGYYRMLDLKLDLDQAAADGLWRLLPDITQVLPIHGGLLRTGKILFFAGSSNNPNRAGGDFRSTVWDYTNGTFSFPPTPIDFFCAGHSFLADGRMLVAGGTKEYDFGHPFFGLRDVFVFDPDSEQWQRVPSMAGGRWYPTLVTLADGRVLAMSGLGEHGEDPFPDLEVYEDPAGWTTLPAALSDRWPLYAHLHLMADGRVFYSGAQFGVNYDHMHPRIIDLAANTIVDIQGLTAMDQRNQGASVLLPPAQAQRVMVMGGGLYGGDMHHHHETTDATDNVNIVDLAAAQPEYQLAAPMHVPRMHVLAVLLPDRTVLVCGGSQMEESRAEATLAAEIYHPASDEWTLAAKAQIPRLYHSVAILLPDGRVLCAGSNPVREDEELRLEMYYPAYLFKGPRPVITDAPAAAAHGAAIPITTPNAAQIKWISLVHPVVMTHTCDSAQRVVDVPFSLDAADQLTATVPANANLVPPGWYMLFLTDGNNIPSTARWIHVG